MVRHLVTAAILAFGMTASAHAASLVANFSTTPTQGPANNSPIDIISLTATDLAGGGVEFSVTGLLSAEGVGSFFILGADADDFTGDVFNASSSNAYTQLGGTGTVFTTSGNALFSGANLTFETVGAGASTADFLGATIGFISVLDSSPGLFSALYGGTFDALDTPAVPLPAGLPLLLVGLGAFGVVRRKASKAA